MQQLGVQLSVGKVLRSMCLATVLAASIGVWTYIRQVYFFNPLTFHKDDVTYLPFKWYRNPLLVEYHQSNHINQKKDVSFTNRNDVEAMIQRLRQAEPLPTAPQLSSYDRMNEEDVLIRQGTKDSLPDGAILLWIRVYPRLHAAVIQQASGGPGALPLTVEPPALQLNPQFQLWIQSHLEKASAKTFGAG